MDFPDSLTLEETSAILTGTELQIEIFHASTVLG